MSEHNEQKGLQGNECDSLSLPRERIDWFTRPIAKFLRIEAAAGLVLFVFTIAALALSNSALNHRFLEIWETPIGLILGSFEWTRSVREWINDGLMTLFFFLVSLELKRELVLGELSDPSKAALSIMAALGGMLVPAIVYLSFQLGLPGYNGWGTVMATDTAFVIGCLALLGNRIPQSLRIFMLSLAIVDDIGAILVVAIGYGDTINWQMLILALAGLIFMGWMNFLGIRNLGIFFLCGVLIWIIVDISGIHATVTGVILGLMAPTKSWISNELLNVIFEGVTSRPKNETWNGNTNSRKALRMAEVAARETLSPVEQLEIILHPWVGFFIMPLFAFANAGISLSFADLNNPVFLAVFVSFVLGKPMGICGFSWLAIRLGLAVRPPDLDWILLVAGGLLAGIGFTMSLFVANLAYSTALISSAKLGIFAASIFCGGTGMTLLAGWYCLGKRSQGIDKSTYSQG